MLLNILKVFLSTTVLTFLFLAPPIVKKHLAIDTTAFAQPQRKRRVAILDFDFSTVSTSSVLASYPGISRGVSDILTNRLVQDGTYSVIERSRIEAVLREQNLGQSGRVDPSTAAQIGKILGVDAVLIGSVTRLDIQSRQSGFGAGFLFGVDVKTTDVDAYVQLNTRLVSTSTAEIVSVAEGMGNVSQSDSSVSVLTIGGGTASSNTEKLVFLATEKAIDQVTGQIVNSAAKLPSVAIDTTALVADITGNTITINKGSTDGFEVGMRFSIERVSKEVKDPATGQVLRRVTQPIGQIQLTEVDKKFSVGKIISGSKFMVNDIAKPLN